MWNLFDRFGKKPPPRLYVVTPYDQIEFREYADEYWLPTLGALTFRDTADAAREAWRTVRHDSRDPTAIMLDWAHLHSKTSYYRFYERFLETHPKGQPLPQLGCPPARPSFDKPALVLHEHEAEDPRWRDGAGFTILTAEVCLPGPLRDGLARELRQRPAKRLVVVGFPVPPFDLPLSRTIEKNAPIDNPYLALFETETVEIEVF